MMSILILIGVIFLIIIIICLWIQNVRETSRQISDTFSYQKSTIGRIGYFLFCTGAILLFAIPMGMTMFSMTLPINYIIIALIPGIIFFCGGAIMKNKKPKRQKKESEN